MYLILNYDWYISYTYSGIRTHDADESSVHYRRDLVERCAVQVTVIFAVIHKPTSVYIAQTTINLLEYRHYSTLFCSFATQTC